MSTTRPRLTDRSLSTLYRMLRATLPVAGPDSVSVRILRRAIAVKRAARRPRAKRKPSAAGGRHAS